MKKLYCVLFYFIILSANAQVVNFSESSFFKYLLLQTDPDTMIALDSNENSFCPDLNGDGEIQVSEALLVKEIRYYGDQENQIGLSEMQGITEFSNLEILRIPNNYIVNLDLSGLSNLQILDCGENNISSLLLNDLNSLDNLRCSGNEITSLDLSGVPNITSLICAANIISELDLSFVPNLLGFYGDNNMFTDIDLSVVPNLEVLYLSNNQLTALDVTALPNLTTLYIPGNQIQTLNLSNCPQLVEVNCTNNLISLLDVSGLENLVQLEIPGNQLAGVDITGLYSLQYLDLNDNPINNVTDIGSSDTLQFLGLATTLLSTFEITDYPNLVNADLRYCAALTTIFAKNQTLAGLMLDGSSQLEYVCVDGALVNTIQNHLTELQFTNTVVNSYCSFVPGGAYYTLSGTSNFDLAKDGCDESDDVLPFVKFSLASDDETTEYIASQTGDFSMAFPAGSYTVSPILEHPDYFNVTPASVEVTFPEAGDTNQNFCFRANGIKQDLAVYLLPEGPARPGFDCLYKLRYQNVGNTPLSGTVTLSFDDAVSDFVSASEMPSSQITNQIHFDYSALNPFETREISVVLNLNSTQETPAVNMGDVLELYASGLVPLDQNQEDNMQQLAQTVVNGFDPNDKTCLQGSFVGPEIIGGYVEYMIRFENTGTFAAQNIVVKDNIDISKYDITTLGPLDSSHDFITRIEGNQVEFIFENINLPFEDELNDGFVTFRIKTLPTLVVGDTFSNSAAIYFDYNLPVITDPAVTTIQVLSVSELDFDKNFVLYPNPANDSVRIRSNGPAVKFADIYNVAGQLVQTCIGMQTLDVSSLKTGIYVLKVHTDQGISSTRFTKK